MMAAGGKPGDAIACRENGISAYLRQPIAPNQINKTLTRLSQILELAVEYELLPANPAAGRRRRLKATKPRRLYLEPEQLMTFLEAPQRVLSRDYLLDSTKNRTGTIRLSCK